MDKDVRNAIQRATQGARALLEREVGQQLEGIYDIRLDGTIPAEPGAHLDEAQRLTREKLLAAVNHYGALGRTRVESVGDYLREAAFTTLNRFVALKMLEARELVQQCVSRGDQSAGFREFCGLAPGLVQLPDQGYRLYLESLFDEIGQEVGILFDRRDPSSLIWPRRAALNELLEILNAQQLATVWDDDETVGWVYQYFNSSDERKQMRDESHAPRNSRELAVRNQFFTPRYVVRFLVDNTLGRTWWQMRGGDTQLTEICEFLVLDNPVELVRQKKDPRDIKILDPACGSGHFLLYAFDLLETIYEEAWRDDACPVAAETKLSLSTEYGDLSELRRALPGMILRNNLFGVDIDPRAAQIAALALWLRAQRGYRRYEIPVDERPRITRTHIVVAEPMPGDGSLVETFASSLQPPLLGDLFKHMVSEMRLAGELGTLLRVDAAISGTLTAVREEFVRQATIKHLPGLEPERQRGDLDFSEIDDVRFFEEAEGMLLEALHNFSETATGGGAVRRWLFADDAAQGIAFIELARTRFDVVLMNPPFGRPVERTYKLVSDQYPGYHSDIYLAFLKRAEELAPEGSIGCITSRSFLVKRRLESARSALYIPHLTLLWDLGLGVMDDAAVESAAYILDSEEHYAALFVDSRSALSKELRTSARTLVPDMRKFQELPFSKIIWALPSSVERLFRTAERYEPAAGTAREGMKTFSDERFLRLPWEVKRHDSSHWVPFVKGGENSPFFGQVFMLLNRSKDGAELDAINEGLNGSRAQVRQASKYWYRAGATYSRRAPEFAARALPAGCVFSGRGPAILPEPHIDPYLHLAWLNSTLVRRLVELQSNKQEYMTGTIKSLPWVEFDGDTTDRLRRFVVGLHDRWASQDAQNELSVLFATPTISAGTHHSAGLRDEAEQAELDAIVNRAYGIEQSDVDELVELLADDEEAFVEVEANDADQSDEPWLPSTKAVLQWAVGVALGRFDVRFATGERELPPPVDPFGEVPVHAPAILVEERGGTALASTYPITVPADGILVDDPGDRRDIIAALRAVYEAVYADDADDMWQEAAQEHEPRRGDLRSWMAGQFFGEHLKRYSRNRRKAPLYWQLAPPSARYSVWLYAHRLTDDSFFRLQSDVLVPKLAYEDRQLSSLVETSGATPPAKERREIEAQESFVEELRVLLDEVKRVAPLWKPTFDDGIVIVMAPLWRLVRHKAWQRELKKTWAELAEGKYDWAHLAMHLWPERVVPKCAEDHSLAIAHGLEDVFWVQDNDDKWEPREKPTANVEKLVSERTSAAVQDALRAVP
jgi:hypothetical protein